MNTNINHSHTVALDDGTAAIILYLQILDKTHTETVAPVVVALRIDSARIEVEAVRDVRVVSSR